jgi:pimeloyl-ACP methyl ester carboxylesterase
VAAIDCRAAQELTTVPTRSGVTESYLLIRSPPNATPKVVVIAFVGGSGAIGLEGKQIPMGFGPNTNFLIRLRNDLVDRDFAEVLIEVPSDKLRQGMSDEFRLGSEHLTDIRAVLADVKKRFPEAKIFLVGTSRGTISAAALAAKLEGEVQGAILTSTVTQRDRDGPALSTFNFASIKVPVLLVHHRDDACKPSPYWAVEHLARSWPLVSVTGGDPPQSGPCDPQSAHGYWGRDAAVAQAIKAWMLGQDFPRELH